MPRILRRRQPPDPVAAVGDGGAGGYGVQAGPVVAANGVQFHHAGGNLIVQQVDGNFFMQPIQPLAADHYRPLTAEAQQRARDLLLTFLSDEQREHFLARGWVREVLANGVSYMLGPDYSSGVIRLSDYGAALLCIHSRQSLPFGDQILAWLLSIRSNEEMFADTAFLHGAGSVHDPSWEQHMDTLGKRWARYLL